MKFKFAHNNFNVLDLKRSLEFYAAALDFKESHRLEADGFTLVYLSDGGESSHELELTFIPDRKESYNLGENEFHLAVTVDDFAAAYERHKAMGCICYENKTMGIYFINDPDGYWIEILPQDR